MRRFAFLLYNEVKMFRTAIPIHLVAVIQPTVMYLLMTVILVHPTFDMLVAEPKTGPGLDLVAEMERVASPIGASYINVIPAERKADTPARQVVAVENRDGRPTAVQYFGLIDSNMVKNYRNRLTAAALNLWNRRLGERAITVEEHPWLPRDIPYTLYFGMAMMTMAAFLAASIIGGVQCAQEFEGRTIIEYRLAPAAEIVILAARLVRLVLSSLLSAGILLAVIGMVTGALPDSIPGVALILLPLAIMAGCFGIMAGLLLRRTIPAFLVALVVSFVGWIMGGSFGLAAGFGTAYESVSRFIPFTHAVELLFHRYYGTAVGKPGISILILACSAAAMLVVTVPVYRLRVLGRRG